RYRVPFVLCYLEGKTLAEAAQLLGRTRNTIGTRLARARHRLRARLARRGLGFPAAAVAAWFADRATAGLPAALGGATLAAAVGPGPVPAHVVALTQGVLHAMFVSKLKSAAVVFLMAVTLGGGVGGLGYGMYAGDPPAVREPAKATPDEAP